MICQKLCHNNLSGWGSLKVKSKPKDTIQHNTTKYTTLYYRYITGIIYRSTHSYQETLRARTQIDKYMSWRFIPLYIYVYSHHILQIYIYVCVCGYGSKTKGMDCSGVIRTYRTSEFCMRGYQVWSGPIVKVYWSDLVKLPSGKLT
jgi:hypothetical protein